MGKNILVLTGSPRKNGNSFAMTDAFIQAAEVKGHTITRFDTAMMNVNGCQDCKACFKTGKACAFDDDFNIIAPAIEAADAIVFTMPVYWYTVPAQLKAVIDKLFAFAVGRKKLSGKECALITCCEEKEMTTMDGVRFVYEKTAAFWKWQSVGEVLVPGVFKAGDIEKTDGKEQAAALADKF
jgi:multimeric flavodoxin WrbA